MKRALLMLFAGIGLLVPGAQAQVKPDLLRIEWVSGIFIQGDMASAAFEFDTTPFGGVAVEREDGSLDVDPAFLYGLRTDYRLSNRFSLSGSWMHAVGQYRVEFPALATDPGNFDLEGLILGMFDFVASDDGRLSSAMSDARIDVYQAALRYEIPLLGRWAFPYVTAGSGLYTQKSDGAVIRSQYEEDPPVFFETLIAAGQDPLQGVGISRFTIDQKNWILSFGGGIRASMSDRWGVDLQFEDIVQMGADFTDIDASSTPPADAINSGRLFSTTFVGNEGAIHNFTLRFALNYAFWPSGSRR